MKTLISLLLTLSAVHLSAQDLLPRFRDMYQDGRYQEIISYKPKKKDVLSGKAIYYVAMAHYKLQEDDAALSEMDKAIATGPADWDMFYYKGMILLYQSKPADALPCMERSIQMLPGEPDFVAGKAQAFQALGKNDSAITYYKMASGLQGCRSYVYVQLAELYQEANNPSQSYEAYEQALAHMTPDDPGRQNCAYNIGLMEELTGRFEEARVTFEAFVKQYPDDYRAISKMMQAYYALGQYEKAAPYRQQLYDAKKAHKLPEEMKDMFCYDQFLKDTFRIMAWERFVPRGEMVKVKYIFYVKGAHDSLLYHIDLESDDMLGTTGSSRYVLCTVRDGSYSTHWKYVFPENFSYPVVKAAVLELVH